MEARGYELHLFTPQTAGVAKGQGWKGNENLFDPMEALVRIRARINPLRLTQ